jgi:hypothetical protein
LIEAELGAGNVTAAAGLADELEHRVAGVELPAVAASVALARARVAAAQDDSARAIELLEHGLEQLSDAEHPCLRAALHLELASLRARDDRAAAVIDARAAAAIQARLDTPAPPGMEELLQLLDVPGSGSGDAGGSRRASASLTRAGGRWTLTFGDAVASLKDSKGLRYLRELIVHPGVDRHVLDLVELAEGPGEAAVDSRGLGPDRRGLGDAGELLDADAKRAYRRRIEELREQLDEAELLGDEDRAWELQAELDKLAGELARAIGLGGRDRRAGSAAERARVNVTRAIRTAIARIEEVLPGLGRHLDRSVQTGCFCRYEPSAADAVDWREEVFTAR